MTNADKEAVLRILVDAIDGGEECRGRDAGITNAYDAIRALPTTTITDEMVEAAARELHRQAHSAITFDTLLDWQRLGRLHESRAILEAAWGTR